jgi:hypothetical protein
MQRQHAKCAEHPQRGGRRRQAAAGQSDWGHCGDSVRPEDEVGGAADHRDQRPADADRVQRGAGEQIEHQYEPGEADGGARERHG